MHCPKCHAPMHTYNRSGVQIEQCSGCRGIFLDFGELESLTQLESQWIEQNPPGSMGWGIGRGRMHGGGHGYRHHGHHGFSHMLFSS
jgi:uncharacterized protein